MHIHRPLLLVAIAMSWPRAAPALPIGPNLFCDVYPNAPACLAGLPACTYCHEGTPPARNAFGRSVEMNLLPGAPRPLTLADYAANIGDALHAAEGLDADGDGFSNLDEIDAGTSPSDGRSSPNSIVCGEGVNPAYDVCAYDPIYVFKKLRLDFCGTSPTYLEIERFVAESDKTSALDRALEVCLDSSFWLDKNGQVWQLAHRKIRPLQAIKQGEDQGQIPLADYYDDYNLFVYSQIDDHDARDVLLADYFVVKSGTSYTVGPPTGEQNVEISRRAGLLTTRWNLVYNVMFTALPRTAAAQAYRAFLGMDIARLEGIFMVDGEPKDYDNKGVDDQDTCEYCHTTLDPLAYPFRNYNGLTGDVASYEPNRIERHFAGEAPMITGIPEAGFILGMPVANLGEWARVAANSDQFASATVLDYWKLLMGGEPLASDQAEFETLWRDFRGKHAYSVERMLHDLVKTEAYGVP